MTTLTAWMFLTAAAAAEPPATVEDLSEMSLAELLEVKVTTATRNERSLAEVPATMYLLTDATIRDRGYETVIDVLMDLPEVQIAFRATEETPSWVTMRGISGNDHFLILRDGVRAMPATGKPENLLQTWSLFDVKRIEVILGPASALYGADAFAGIVNVITKSGADLQGAAITASYGMFHTTHDAVVWGDQFGNIQLSAAGQIYHSDDPEMPKYYPDDYAAYFDYRQTGQLDLWGTPTDVPNVPWSMPYDAASVHLKASLNNLDLSYFFSAQRYVPAYATTVNQTMYSDQMQRFLDYRDQIAAHHRYQTAGARPVTFETTLARTSNWIDPSSGYRNLFTNYERTYNAEWGTQSTAQELVTWPLADHWTAAAGVSYDDLTGMPKSTDIDRPYDPSVPTGSQSALYPGTDKPVNFYVIEDRNVGATGQLQARLAPSVEVTLGSRYDHNTRYGSTVNPRLGVVLRPVDAWTTKLLYGEAFLAPTLFAAFQHYGSFDCTAPDTCTGGFFHVPNPNLKPEKLRTGEISTMYAWTPEVITTVSAYYTRVGNQIDLEGDDRIGKFLGVEGVDLQAATNRGTLTAYGGTVRTEVRVPLGAVDLRADASYTYTDGDIARDDVKGHLPSAAPHAVKAGLGLGWNRLTVSPRLIVVSDTLTTQQNTVPASVLVDLSARYDDLLGSERRPLDVFVRATNLLDRRYYAPPAIDLGGGFTMAMIPQDPLRLTAGVTVEL